MWMCQENIAHVKAFRYERRVANHVAMEKDMALRQMFPMKQEIEIYSVQHYMELEKLENKYAPQKVEPEPPPPRMKAEVDPLGSLHEPLPEHLRMPPPPRKVSEDRTVGRPRATDRVGEHLCDLIADVYCKRKGIEHDQAGPADLGRFVDPQRELWSTVQPSTAWANLLKRVRIPYSTLIAIARNTRIEIEAFENVIDMENHIDGDIPQARFKVQTKEFVNGNDSASSQ